MINSGHPCIYITIIQKQSFQSPGKNNVG